MKTIAIIGGGAAGLAAAVAAVHEARDANVMVFEADDRVGRSILATGNGRCNFSNAQVDAGMYRNGEFVRAAFNELARQVCSGDESAAGVCEATAEHAAVSCVTAESAPSPRAAGDPVHAFFAELGFMWREEGEGRLYPLANKASSVLDVLRAALVREGVQLACERRATRIDAPEHAGGRYHVRFADGSVEHAHAVIVATGGRTARELVPGHLAFIEPRPVLGPLRTETALVKPLNNIRVRCMATLVAPDGTPRASEVGEVLFRDYGVSGIAIFNLSRFAEAGDTLMLDLLPQLDEAACEAELQARFNRLGAPTGEELFTGMLLPAVARAVLKQAGLRTEAALAVRDIPTLAHSLKAFTLTVHGIGDARQCQVSRGGFAVEAFNPRTMEAYDLPGLHVVGEALDVDAPCGGYNLHWAWTTGLIAGHHAATMAQQYR